MIDFKELIEYFKHYMDNKKKLDEKIEKWIKEEEDDE